MICFEHDFFKQLPTNVLTNLLILRLRTPEEIHNRIIQQVFLINEEMIRRAIDKIHFRIFHCQEMNGSHYEPIILKKVLFSYK